MTASETNLPLMRDLNINSHKERIDTNHHLSGLCDTFSL